jgi:2-aminoadipate transaminase
MSTPFQLSQISQSMQPSPIRELFKLVRQPGMISFAGGLPDPAIFPVDAFASCADVLARDGVQVLQYGASEGYAPLRTQLLERTSALLGREIAPEELLITSGSQQAVDLVARALLDPGDVVLVEAPTYPGTLHALRNTGARFATVPCDGDGMQVDVLPEIASQCESETGRRPRLIYSVPDFSNPSGACLSAARRARLVELAAELEIPVFEDDPYSRLRYAGDDLPKIAAHEDAQPWVVYASSFSKVLAPGVRVAWCVADPTLIRTMVLLRQGEDLCTSTVTQALVAEYCQRGLLEDHLTRIVDHYAHKCRAMQRHLAEHLAGGPATWHEPAGGFFFWLRFDGLDGQQLFDRAIAEKIAFVPGAAFYPGSGEQVGFRQEGTHQGRLCFTFASEETIAEGCRRLARAAKTAIEAA